MFTRLRFPVLFFPTKSEEDPSLEAERQLPYIRLQVEENNLQLYGTLTTCQARLTSEHVLRPSHK